MHDQKSKRLFVKMYICMYLFLIVLIASNFNDLIAKDGVLIASLTLAILALILTIPVYAVLIFILHLKKRKSETHLQVKEFESKRIDPDVTSNDELDLDILDLERWSLIEDLYYTSKPQILSYSDTKTQIWKSDVELYQRYIETAQTKAFSAPHYYIKEYIPKWTGQQDDFSQMVLLFKKYDQLSHSAQRAMINYFVNALISIIREKGIDADIIIPIPSSKAGIISEGHTEICHQIANILGIENGTGALERITTVPKSAHGNRPPYEMHYESFAINPRFDLRGKKVILFDDVYTTGNTARAAAQKVYEAGAEKVWIITLGKTKRWY